jgi:hypothetical protein
MSLKIKKNLDVKNDLEVLFECVLKYICIYMKKHKINVFYCYLVVLIFHVKNKKKI